MKRLIHKMIPRFVVTLYHWLWAVGSAIWYRHPSKKLVVIGITGTKGKSTTANMVHQMLQASGKKAGLMSSVAYRIGDEELDSVKKMTTPGRGMIQRLMRQMVREGCSHVVLEVSSEGIAQSRHLRIAFDVVALVNLMPEHIESHGSYEAYRAAKLRLFEETSVLPPKMLQGVDDAVPRVCVLPETLEHPEDLAFFQAPTFPQTVTAGLDGAAMVRGENLRATASSSSFSLVLNDVAHDVTLETPGMFYVSNALIASAISSALGISSEVIVGALNAFRGLPGRMERVASEPFLVIVDYAHEPVSYRNALTSARMMSEAHGRVLAVIGATGGGRDMERRPRFGEIADELADIVVVTNEDPYDEDPQAIIDQVFSGLVRSGSKQEGEDAFRLLERREAIKKVLDIAAPGDVVILLGKGSETVMAVSEGRHVPWSDKETILELLSENKTTAP